ncbi:XrtA/PEP-CTERM system TPR-repeat protein PrsT [Thalassotalea sp. G2M2-11]|uniref:XrtA/PEP-CTERM system TPR-repeat protein PrsT n=1 Tax=Thalassotalea sp. G2M2-11 TaxID=2787627 RepID=UPI0019D0C14E|nr:XrtA/PEP-CTERM system TPR-repeat protein PrsT [Thalassotalea sp. G2M2-11]
MKRIILLCVVLLLGACSPQSSESYLQSAQQLMENQDYQAAVIELKNAIKQSPDMAQARFLLGQVYLSQGAYESAEKELNKALALKYPSAQVLPLLSQAYQKSRSDVALLDLDHQDTGLSLAQSAQVAFYKLQAMFRLEQKEKVNALIEEIQLLDTDSVFKQLAFVYSLVMNQQVDAALEQLDSIIAAHEDQSDALKLKAILLARSGELAAAADTYLSYVSYFPNDLEVSFITARLLVELDRTVEAEPLIDTLLTVNEDNGLLNQLKGIVRYKAKDLENALTYTEKAIIADPNDPALRLLAGYSAYQLDDFEKANQYLSMIAQDLPQDHQALRMLAVSQLRLGLTEQAGDTIAALDGLSDKDNALVSTIGLALMRQGDIDKARSMLTKSDELSAQTAEDLTRLGLLKLSLNDVSGIAKLEQALDKKPDQPFTRQTLATAYLSSKKYDKALALAKQWQSENEQDIQAITLEASVYAHQGKLALAKKTFQRAITFAPDDANAYLALAQLAISEQDYANATHYVNTVLKQQPYHMGALVKYYLLAVANNSAEQAMQLLQQRFDEQPDHQGLRLLLAKVYLHEKQYQDSIEVLTNFPQENAPQVYWKTLSQAYYGNKQFEQLTKLNQQWLEQRPNNKEAVISNLILLNSQREYEQGLALSQRFLEKDKNNIAVRLFYTHFLLIKGDMKSAKANFTALPEQAKNSAFAKGILGQLQVADKQYAKALPNLETAYKAQPSARNMRLVYLCLNRMSKQQAADDFLRAHVDNFPNDGESLMQFAQLQLATDIDGAIKSYQHALTINDKNFIALNNLAYFSLQRNDIDKAQQYVERALAIRPNMPDVLDTAGRIYMAKEEYSQALQHLTKAVNQSTGVVKEEIYLNYVEALLLNNEVTLAKRKLNQREFAELKSKTRAEQLRKTYHLLP